MATYICLLRGINVGNNMLKMERLRVLCDELKFANTQTYIQSGNVVFDAPGTADACLAKIERKLAGETRLPVKVTLRTASQWRKIASGNPFLDEKGIDPTKQHVTFLAARPTKDAWKKLAALDAAGDRYHAIGQEVYLHCPNGYGRSKLANPTLERTLGVTATTRNWNTVQKLLALAES